MSVLSAVSNWLLEPEDLPTPEPEPAPTAYADNPEPDPHVVNPATMSVGDPNIVEWLNLRGYSVPEMDDTKAKGITAYWRGVRILTDTVAGLSLKSYELDEAGVPHRVATFLDTPAGPYAASDIGKFTWAQWIMGALVQRGEAYLQHTYNGGGQIIGTLPVPPARVSKKWKTDNNGRVYKEFRVRRGSRTDTYESDSLTHGMSQILAFTEDGINGISPLELFRRTLQTAAAGDEAASRAFRGALMAGLVNADEDVLPEEAAALNSLIRSTFNGAETAGQVLFVNKKLKFTPWSMTSKDAMFLESRAFQIEEVARIFGLPIHLFSVMGAVSNWGTGIAEGNLGLSKFTLMPYTNAIADALSRLLPDNQYVEFDYKSLLQGTPAQQIELTLAQYAAGVLTLNETRVLLGLTPMPGGDTLKAAKPAAPPAPPAPPQNQDDEEDPA